MIAIMQPTFLPWIGYFAMIERVDAFIFLDQVQFEQRSWQSRNKIKLHDQIHYLSLSCKKSPQKTLLKDIRLSDEEKWRQKMIKTLHHAYAKSVNYQRYFYLFEEKLNAHSKLCELNIDLITQFCQDLSIKTPLYRASNLNLHPAKREDLLLQICKLFKTQIYLSPEGSKNYLQSDYAKKIFEDAGIKILYFDFSHPNYIQQGGGGFIPYLSVLDFLFNVEKSKLQFQTYKT